MTCWVIDISATEVRVGKGSEILICSPGYAVVDRDNIWLGEEARDQAHLHPHRTYNRFWSHLDQDTLRTPSRRFRHNADLAYAHLLALYEQAGEPEEVIFAVPGYFSSQQLSLLLGIAQACPFAAVGLVDRAVASAAGVVEPGRYLHLDIDLYHTVLTQLKVGSEIIRRSVEILDDVGLKVLYELSADLIADTFIQQSRFDPRQHGESEQALYNQLPRCVASNRQEVVAEIPFQGTRYQAKLSREILLERLQPYYVKMWRRLAPQHQLLLSDRMAALPEFTANLSNYKFVAPEAVFKGCQEHEAVIRSPGPHLKFITRLPVAIRHQTATAPLKQPPGEPVQSREGAKAGIYLLSGHYAFPLGEQPIYLSAGGAVSSVMGESSICSVVWSHRQVLITPLGKVTVYINGQPLTSASSLGIGDEVSVAGSDAVYWLIQRAHPDAW
jgi:hypothetical protein